MLKVLLCFAPSDLNNRPIFNSNSLKFNDEELKSQSFQDILIKYAERLSSHDWYKNLCIGDIITFGMDSKWRWLKIKFFDVYDSKGNYKMTKPIPYWYWMKYYPNRSLYDYCNPNNFKQFDIYFQNTCPLNKIENAQNFCDFERIFKEYECRAFKVSNIRNYNFTTVDNRKRDIQCIDYEIMSKSLITHPLSVVYSNFEISVDNLCNEFKLYHEGKHDLIFLIAVDKYFNEIQYYSIESLTSKKDYSGALDFINRNQNVAGLYVPKGYSNEFVFNEGLRVVKDYNKEYSYNSYVTASNFLKSSLLLLIYFIINYNLNPSLSLRTSIGNCKIYNCLFPKTFKSFDS